MKKLYLTFLLIPFLPVFVSAQQFPAFLHGTWKLENKETYEHWDLLNENSLKGFSYKITNGKMVVTEYLEINKIGDEIIYTATVLNQNQGVGIDFKLNKKEGIYLFENPNHDFPKFIQYEIISDNEMKIEVGTVENNFSLIFQRVK
jgi:hypothetical protein